MGERADLYAGFLYGVNIPGGIWLKAAEVEAKLREYFRELTFADRDGAAWEFGIVLSSVDLPAGAAFHPTKNARLLDVIERRAVLAHKRCVTTTSSRIM